MQEVEEHVRLLTAKETELAEAIERLEAEGEVAISIQTERITNLVGDGFTFDQRLIVTRQWQELLLCSGNCLAPLLRRVQLR